jgi:hypothetical protein
MRRVGGAVIVHRLVPWRGTTRWSYHNLPLLYLLVPMDLIIYDDDIADEVWERPSSVERHALLQLSGEANHEAVLFLVIRVHLVRLILH